MPSLNLLPDFAQTHMRVLPGPPLHNCAALGALQCCKATLTYFAHLRRAQVPFHTSLRLHWACCNDRLGRKTSKATTSSQVRQHSRQPSCNILGTLTELGCRICKRDFIPPDSKHLQKPQFLISGLRAPGQSLQLPERQSKSS